MRSLSTIFAGSVALLLAACGSERSGEFTTEDGESGTYTIDGGSAEASATIETPDGTATMRSGANVPVDLPGGFTLYPGASVVSNTTIDHADGKGTMLMLQTGDAPEKVIGHYRKQAEAADVKIQLQMTTEQGMMIAGEGPGGLTVSVNASRDGDGPTQAQLMLGQRPGG
ncbi:hypothetical protein [Erythrobacter sp. JK5]|uniref:hypothetical protein n=1 Tax=Erythrobacter sp. JK5 TaxID=2829500 RepID=UPI001BA5B78F|nr:hypothetical protein [Erythrobacter sp. JK5]QUL38244.1 hypothetical protein KDC96_02155 [Erythrobacter sp. JK5]